MRERRFLSTIIPGWSGTPSKTITEARIRAARRALDRGDYDEAGRYLERLLKAERHNQETDRTGS